MAELMEMPTIQQVTLLWILQYDKCSVVTCVRWEQPAQLCTPWVTVDGMNLQQWLVKWKVLASRLRQLPPASASTAH